MTNNPIKYVCDFRNDPDDAAIYLSSIEAVFPHLSIAAAEINSAELPTIPVGRVRVTIQMPWGTEAARQASLALHGEIMQVPGVELFSGNIEA